jgi:hypothetical protein
MNEQWLEGSSSQHQERSTSRGRRDSARPTEKPYQRQQRVAPWNFSVLSQKLEAEKTDHPVEPRIEAASPSHDQGSPATLPQTIEKIHLSDNKEPITGMNMDPVTQKVYSYPRGKSKEAIERRTMEAYDRTNDRTKPSTTTIGKYSNVRIDSSRAAEHEKELILSATAAKITSLLMDHGRRKITIDDLVEQTASFRNETQAIDRQLRAWLRWEARSQGSQVTWMEDGGLKISSQGGSTDVWFPLNEEITRYSRGFARQPLRDFQSKDGVKLTIKQHVAMHMALIEFYQNEGYQYRYNPKKFRDEYKYEDEEGITRFGIAQNAPDQAAHDDIWKKAIKFKLGYNAFNLGQVLNSSRQDPDRS